MIDSSGRGPRRARWAAAIFAMVAAVLIGLVQPASDASAQTSFGGGNLTIVSLATTATPASRDVGLIWNAGPAPGGYAINRITTIASGNATLTVPNPPLVISPTQNFFIDTVPASAGNAACYRVVPLTATGTAAGSSDLMCIILGVAQGTVPVNARAELDQGPNLKVTWDATPGAAGFIVWGVGTDGVQVTTGNTVTLPGTGTLICAVVLALNAGGGIIGASNILCGFPGFSLNVIGTGIQLTPVPLTATRTNTPGSLTPTNTSTNTAVPPVTNTNTVGPTNTSTITPIFTNTVTQTSTPSATATFTPANLSISKTSNPNPVNAGDFLTYTITILNSGQSTAPGTAITDALPAGVTFLAVADVDGRFSNSCNNNGNLVGCTGGTIPGGTVSNPSVSRVNILVTVDNPCVVVSPVRNRVTLNPSNVPPGPTTTNDTVINGCAQATPTITNTPTKTSTPTSGVPTNSPTLTATPAVDLTIAKIDAPDPIVGGNQLTYLLLVQNTGTSSASAITVTDTLENGFNYACPAFPCNSSDPNAANGVTFASANGTSGGGNFNCSPSTSGAPPVTLVTCTGGQIGPNGGATIEIVVNTQAGCQFIVNGATVSTTAAESNTGNNSAYSQTACGAGANTPTPLFTPAATNTAVGPTGTATATTTPIGVGGFTMTKSSNPSTVSANAPNNSSGTVTQNFSYVMTLTNNTTAPINGIILTDSLPFNPNVAHGFPLHNGQYNADEAIIVASAGFGCTGISFNESDSPPAPNSFTCAGNLAAGSSATISVTSFVPGRNCAANSPNCSNQTGTGFGYNCLNGNPIQNNVRITSSSPPVVNNTASALTFIQGCGATPTATAGPATATPGASPTTPPTSVSATVDLAIRKIENTWGADSAAVSQPSGTISNLASPLTYALTVTNLGSTNATNVTVTDQFAANLTNIQIVSTDHNFGCVLTGTTMNCVGGNINAGDSAFLTFSASLSGTSCPSTVPNTARVNPAGTIAETDFSNNVAFLSENLACPNFAIAHATTTEAVRAAFSPANSDSGAVTGVGNPSVPAGFSAEPGAYNTLLVSNTNSNPGDGVTVDDHFFPGTTLLPPTFVNGTANCSQTLGPAQTVNGVAFPANHPVLHCTNVNNGFFVSGNPIQINVFANSTIYGDTRDVAVVNPAGSGQIPGNTAAETALASVYPFDLQTSSANPNDDTLVPTCATAFTCTFTWGAKAISQAGTATSANSPVAVPAGWVAAGRLGFRSFGEQLPSFNDDTIFSATFTVTGTSATAATTTGACAISTSAAGINGTTPVPSYACTMPSMLTFNTAASANASTFSTATIVVTMTNPSGITHSSTIDANIANRAEMGTCVFGANSPRPSTDQGGTHPICAGEKISTVTLTNNTPWQFNGGLVTDNATGTADSLGSGLKPPKNRFEHHGW